MSLPPPQREPLNLRSLERAIARARGRGPRPQLAHLYLDRVEALLELGEDHEAGRQLEQVLSLLEELEDDAAPILRLKALARRVHFHQRDGEGAEEALADLRLALTELQELPEPRSPEVAELEVELWIQLGHLLLVSEQDDSADALGRAAELADALETPRGWLFQLRARRELAVALAQEEPELGLAQLDEAESGVVEKIELPEMERDLLRSTRAEILANADRHGEALECLRQGWEGGPPAWALAQEVVVHEMSGDARETYHAGARLIERLSTDLDPRDLNACHRLAEALLGQARRSGNPEEQTQLAQRVLRLLDDFPWLPPRSLRLVAQCQELAATHTELDETRELLAARVELLEGLVRDTGAQQDRLERVRAYLQLGDVWMQLDSPREARRCYRWATEDLRAWPPDHPFVLDVYPLALNAYGHALAAGDMWLAAQRQLDEACRATAGRTDPDALLHFFEVFLFRAVTHVNAGDSPGAVALLERDTARLLGAALRHREEPAGHALLDQVVNLRVLAAEILIDQLDDPDGALACYKQALELRQLEADESPSGLASVLGAMGALLNEVGRAEEALPLLEQCVELFEAAEADPQVLGDRALARVNLAQSLSALEKPREALDLLAKASELLEGANAALDDVDDEEEGMRYATVRAELYVQRGQALMAVGHPLLATDELAHAVRDCRRVLDRDEDDEATYEARQRLPRALLERARCWIAAGEHEAEAGHDLREARRIYHALVQEEQRPAHRRLLREVRGLQRSLNGD